MIDDIFSWPITSVGWPRGLLKPISNHAKEKPTDDLLILELAGVTWRKATNNLSLVGSYFQTPDIVFCLYTSTAENHSSLYQ